MKEAILTKLRYDLAETAELLSLSVKSIQRRIEDGKLLGAYRDGRKYFVPAESIIEYQNKLRRF